MSHRDEQIKQCEIMRQINYNAYLEAESYHQSDRLSEANLYQFEENLRHAEVELSNVMNQCDIYSNSGKFNDKELDAISVLLNGFDSETSDREQFHTESDPEETHSRKRQNVCQLTHTGEKPYVSETCGKSFMRIGHMAEHLLTHTGRMPYACETCGKTSTNSSNHKRHMRTHDIEKPFVCDTCGKGFSTVYDINLHTLTHTGEKTHVCETCGKGFLRRGHFNEHLRTHTGEKPYACETCGKKSSTFCNHKRHMQTHT
jgi:uncharacterized Zn-finger protein